MDDPFGGGMPQSTAIRAENGETGALRGVPRRGGRGAFFKKKDVRSARLFFEKKPRRGRLPPQPLQSNG